ncbi:hypothetical protein [Dictyobacter alpinus]|nr:hypothetical protein [Dictyobacter alpinus]
MLDLSIDELLTTTRSVRKRLDLTRPVEAEVIRAGITGSHYQLGSEPTLYCGH